MASEIFGWAIFEVHTPPGRLLREVIDVFPAFWEANREIVHVFRSF
jgi:hypothetical protein